MLWMVKDFDAQTKEKAGGRTRVVLMDGHESSHYTLELLEYVRDYNIVILGYHCPTALMPFRGWMCSLLHQNRGGVSQGDTCCSRDLHMTGVGKGDFCGVFGRALLWAFTPESVRAAFEATGVHPFNPGIITDKHMQPSLPTSTKGTFPLPQISPVRAILKAMGSHPLTSFRSYAPTHGGPIQALPASQLSPTPSPSRPIL